MRRMVYNPGIQAYRVLINIYKENMTIKPNTKYKFTSEHLKKEYGRDTILIEDTVMKVMGGSWMFQQGNPACLKYAIRAADEGLPTDDKVYYGKIGVLGEIVHISELKGENDE